MGVGTCVRAYMCVYIHTCNTLCSSAFGGCCQPWASLTGGSLVQPPGFGPVPRKGTGKVRPSPQLKEEPGSGVRAGAGDTGPSQSSSSNRTTRFLEPGLSSSPVKCNPEHNPLKWVVLFSPLYG